MRNPIQMQANGMRLRFLTSLLAACLLLVAGCKDESFTAIETDANGYICLKCKAKFYTESKVYMDMKCPKCGQNSLNDVVGFLCSKDHHLTIEPRIPGLPTTSTCEQCKAVLKNSMYLPRKKDLEAWGATKAGPP